MHIALIGPPRSGKSSIGDAWLEISGGGERLSFASALKDEVAAVLNKARPEVSHRVLLDDLEAKREYRGLLQWWGVWRRETAGNDYWGSKLRAQIHMVGAHQPWRNIVIDDCRFPNEYDMLKEAGFTFVLLEPGETDRDLGALAEHESEQHWPTFEVDHVLDFELGPEQQARRLETLLHG